MLILDTSALQMQMDGTLNLKSCLLCRMNNIGANLMVALKIGELNGRPQGVPLQELNLEL